MYKFSKLVKEQGVEDGAARTVWVALIQSDEDKQPFRLLIENFETEEDVMKEVSVWIDARNKEDEAACLEREQSAKETIREGVASKINSSL